MQTIVNSINKSYPIDTNKIQGNGLHIRVTSRNSNLALIQVKEIIDLFSNIDFSIIPVQSYGDKHKEISLLNAVAPDFFTRELDEMLLNNEADIAIHSAKDLPYPLHPGLELIALTRPTDQSDAIVSKNNLKLSELPKNAKIGTSSLTRKEEILKIRPDVKIVSLRGTIEERIDQVDNGALDAVIVATCALNRLTLQNRIAEILPFATHPLQGILAIVAKRNNEQLKTIFGKTDHRKNYGTVSLVGFGPGDPELLTRKGYELLKNADIIFYDDLINHNFLDEFGAEKVYVGKRDKNHSIEQPDINRLLYNAALSGKETVRLKGGDPMIFGHGGEETEYLKQNYVKVQVIPGITSALAASAITQIPLTHRNITSSVTFVSGHNPETINFSGNGTIVIYMGTSHSREIANKAKQQGKSPKTPVLLISNISNSNQETEFTNLNSLTLSEIKLKTPLLMIIGDVVGLKSTEKQEKTKPVIWVTGTSGESFNDNYQTLHIPLVKITPLNDYSVLHAYLNKINTFHWLIFTSRHTTAIFFEQLSNIGKDSRYLANIKIASIGKSTSRELQKYGIKPNIEATDESSDGLVNIFKEQNILGNNILIPRSDLALPILPEGLTDFGNNVTTAVIYNNIMPENIAIPEPGSYDAIYFSSPSGIENYLKMGLPLKTHKKIIVQGNQTFFKLIYHGVNPSQVYTKKDFETTMFYI